MKLKQYFVMLFVLLSNSGIFPQSTGIDKVGTTSFQFLKVMTDARSTAMGEAFVSVVNTADAVFWNPAGLTKIQGFDLSSSYVKWFFDVSQISLAAAYNWEGIGHFGFQAMINDLGDIQVTRVDHLVKDANGNYIPGLTGESVSPGFKVFGISFSKELTDKFSFGITAKYATEDLVAKKASALIFDGGLLYKTGFHTVEIAAVLRHFGPEVKFFDRSYPLPQTFTIGISADLFSSGDALFTQIADQRLLLSYNLSQPRDYGQQHHVGIEYSYLNIFFLRAGYKINFDEEGLTLGAGINYKNYRIDYSYNNYGEFLGNVHRFTIGLSIN